jgi:CDP-diacylglycerol--glycerol-3-phosphate 3-phosphatidyltransferase
VTADSPRINTLPNLLTGARLLLVPFLLLAMYAEEGTSLVIGLVFLAACVTDWFDGRLARKLGVVTRFGKVVDPLADRLLVNGAILMLTFYDERLGGWELALIIARDAVASWGWWKVRGAIDSVDVSRAGKWSMGLMMAGLVWTLLLSDAMWPVHLFQVGLVLSVIVMIDYLWRYRKTLFGPRPEAAESADRVQSGNEA